MSATLLEGLTIQTVLIALGALLGAYLFGSIPWAYIIVHLVTGEDVTEHGTGNVGAMNVRRTTGSWGWFAVAMLADISKGVLPVAVAKWFALNTLLVPVGVAAPELPDPSLALIPMGAVAGAVIGHNYSCWMAIIKRRFGRTGKGLATGAGALLAYDWRYFVAVVVVGLLTIAITRYMMAGQVIAAVTLPVTALVLRSPDWWFALVMGALVYLAHHKRFMGLLRGQEPKFYINDRSGPRG
ncbi:MAG: glycerol-3-phosphate acyltransferase [Coriobacteriia bacterium]|nr:glycerol-3-phosphate acyltransferase [Coriobacteriia bacterium]